jgi:hypothetical protein
MRTLGKGKIYEESGRKEEEKKAKSTKKVTLFDSAIKI